ncbi:NADH-quinone oxidoreductase subunit NuoH [uncultured Selenomonas sp.]|uniref:NADH-quinone oxidoreductase subunit NuoH n=1 Tax=uncultured Selenomonas sp. TaxID=159275 RepID=UPI0028DAF850|nr:NADH-quinone oxidoreductase subunit NuoH [uncultured Selenomonas sp.]
METGIVYSYINELRIFLTGALGDAFLAEVVMTLLGIAVLLAIVMTAALVFTFGERKVCAFIQVRFGPNRVGPGGLLQPVADAMKLLSKEDIMPDGADRIVWSLSPILVFVPAALIYAFYPFDAGVVFADVNIGLFLLLAISAQAVLPFFMGGFASNSKYGLIGSMRAVAQLLTYELPLGFALMGVVMLAGSLDMSRIVEAQADCWYIFKQPLAFLIVFICMIAESNRPPFNILEGESEIIAGPFTEYSGMRWALFFLAEFANLLSIAILVTTLFLGGWQGPAFLPGIFWFFLKAVLMVVIFQWVGWTFPRFRIDHQIAFGWKILLPVAMLNVLLTGVGMMIRQMF